MNRRSLFQSLLALVVAPKQPTAGTLNDEGTEPQQIFGTDRSICHIRGWPPQNVSSASEHGLLPSVKDQRYR